MNDAETLAAIREALTSEDEIAHGEAWSDERGGLGVCAYCDELWPCRTQRGIDRALALLDAEAARHREDRLEAIDGCIAIVEQSLNTARAMADDDPESRLLRVSIATREHVVKLLTGYRQMEARRVLQEAP